MSIHVQYCPPAPQTVHFDQHAFDFRNEYAVSARYIGAARGIKGCSVRVNRYNLPDGRPSNKTGILRSPLHLSVLPYGSGFYVDDANASRSAPNLSSVRARNVDRRRQGSSAPRRETSEEAVEARAVVFRTLSMSSTYSLMGGGAENTIRIF